MLDVLIYRLQRLWRVMVLGIVPPVATVLVLQVVFETTFTGLLAFAVVVPVLHVLRYPQQSVETLTVSLLLAASLAFVAFTVPPEMPIVQKSLRYAMVLAAALGALFVVIVPMMTLYTLGPGRRIRYTATEDSRLDVATLKAGLTHYPGRDDDGTTCGPADENGCFHVTYSIAGFHQFNYEGPDGSPADVTEDWDLTQKEDISQYAIVQSTGPTHHEVTYFDGDLKRFEIEDNDVIVVRYDFVALPGGGTRVTVEEIGILMPLAQSFGFWLEDFGRDRLICAIDTLEGRAPRANAAFRVRQLVVELGNLIAPLLGLRRIEPPTS